MIRLPLLTASVALVPLLGACSGTEPVGYEFVKEEGEGELGIWVHSGLYNREYEVHSPPVLQPGERRPLMIFLHGEGETGPTFRRRLRADAATDARRVFTVWPTGLEGSWTVGCAIPCTLAEALRADDVRFLETLIRHLARELPVDTTTIYVVGHSQGAQLAHLFGCRGELQPAGVGAVGGAMFRAVAQDCAPAGAFPVGIVHGDEDPVAYFSGFGPGAAVMSVSETVEAWRDVMGCGGVPSLETRPDTAGDYTSTTIHRFGGCRPGSEVVLYQVHGGGHGWPGDTGPWPVLMGQRSRSLDATCELLELFEGMEPRRGSPPTDPGEVRQPPKVTRTPN